MRWLAKELPVVSINHDKIRLFMRQRGITDTEGNKILYNHLLIVHLAKQYLNKGYSVILDREFPALIIKMF